MCVGNEGCEDLELRKVYQRLPDARAARDGYARVVLEAASWPVGTFFSFPRPGIPAEFTPHLRFSPAVMGPVTLGVLTWFIIDSILLVATGFCDNDMQTDHPRLRLGGG